MPNEVITKELTSRDLLQALVRQIQDLDSPVFLSFHGSDPIAINDVEETEDGLIIRGGS
jgi:hypothetical protein